MFEMFVSKKFNKGSKQLHFERVTEFAKSRTIEFLRSIQQIARPSSASHMQMHQIEDAR